MSRLPRTVLLSGSDYFLLALDRAMEQRGLPGGVCRLVLLLDGALDTKALTQRLDVSPELRWLAGVGLAPRFPSSIPRWKTIAGSVPISLRAHEDIWPDATESLPDVLRETESRPRGGGGVALDLFPRARGKSALVLTWHHALMDARGAELLVRLMGNENAEGSDSPLLLQPDGPVESLFKRLRDFLPRVRLGRTAVRRTVETSQRPFTRFSRGPVRRGAQAQYRVLLFTRGDTERIDANSHAAGAGFRKSLFHLAAAVQAADAVRRERNETAQGYLVPMPYDRRKRGASGPIFSNQLTFLFYRVEPEEVASRRAMVASLAKQMTEQMREEQPACCSIMMEQFRRLPMPVYTRLLRGTTKGAMSSLNFSDVGESGGGLDSFLGTRIERAIHLPPATFPPGVSIAFSRHSGRLSAVVSHTEGCLSAQESDALAAALRAALLESVHASKTAAKQ